MYGKQDQVLFSLIELDHRAGKEKAQTPKECDACSLTRPKHQLETTYIQFLNICTENKIKFSFFLLQRIVKMLAKLYREKDERVLATFPKIMSSNIIRFLYYHCFEITH